MDFLKLSKSRYSVLQYQKKQIPEQYEPVALLIVGYSEEHIEPPKEHFKRKASEDILF